MAFQQQRSRPRLGRDSHSYEYHDESPPPSLLAIDHATAQLGGIGGRHRHATAPAHNDEVLLFGGSSASSMYASAINSDYQHQHQHQQQQPIEPETETLLANSGGDPWTLLSNSAAITLNHNRHRNLSPAATRSSTTSTSAPSAGSSSEVEDPADLSVSLFPAHDGNGRFLSLASGSLVQSVVYERQGGESSSSQASSSSFVRLANVATSETGRSMTEWSEFDRAEVGVSSQSLLSESWALTEAALSTIPDASIGKRIVLRRMEDASSAEQGLIAEGQFEDDDRQSAGFTSDSSLDFDDKIVSRSQVHRATTPKASSRRTRFTPFNEQEANKARQKAEEEEEEKDLLFKTPGAESAGLHSKPRRHVEKLSSSYEQHRTPIVGLGRDAYPSPPPEDQISASKSSVKRRHRRSGRSGSSQKRSSTSGSIRNRLLNNVTNTLPTIAQSLEDQQMAQARREELQSQMWLGRIVAGNNGMSIDDEVLELYADAVDAAPFTPEATPTPSRAVSPRHWVATPKQSKTHGIGKLLQHVETELGTSSTMFQLHEDEEEEESEEEEEVDIKVAKTTLTTWHRNDSPLVFAPRRLSSTLTARSNSTTTVLDANSSQSSTKDTSPPRSLSTSSLPSYLNRSKPLSSSSNSGKTSLDLMMNHDDELDSFFENGRIMRRTTSLSESDESPWGGEFDGLEAAIVYWRSLWRKIRGLGTSIGVEGREEIL